MHAWCPSSSGRLQQADSTLPSITNQQNAAGRVKAGVIQLYQQRRRGLTCSVHSAAAQPLLEQRQQQEHPLQHRRWRSTQNQPHHKQQQLWSSDSSSSGSPATADGMACGLPRSLAAVPPSSQQDNKEPYVPAGTAEGRDRQLTAHIARRRHWVQLQLIWLDNSTNFSPIHLTATITKLARLVEAQGVAAADRPELFKFSSAIMSSVHLLLDALDPRGAAQCLWAYAKLQSLSPHSSRSGDAAADALAAALLHRHMHQLQQQELSQVAWAAAVLQPVGLTLPEGWWAALQDRLLQLLQPAVQLPGQPAVQPAEVACIAWASAKAHARPQPAVIAAIMHHAEGRMGEYGAKELLQLLLAAAAWQHTPAAAWQQHCCQQLQQLVPTMVAQDVSNSLLALARLQAQPPVTLISALLQRLQPQLPAASAQVLVTVPYALAKLQLNPQPEWWAGFLPYTLVALQRLNPSGMAVLAWSLARLGLHPGKPWVDELLQQSVYKLAGFAAQELAMLVWALGKWAAAPSLWWWERFEEVSADRADDFTAAELGALLVGVASMVIPAAYTAAKPVAAAEAAIAPAGGTDGPAGDVLITSDHHQQQQWHSPSQAWTAKLLSAAETDLSGAPADSLAGILSGVARLAVRPSLAWLSGFEAAAAAALPQATLASAAAVLWGYAVLGVQPSRRLMTRFNDRLCELLQASSRRGSSSMSMSMSRRRRAAAAAAAAAADAALAAAAAGRYLHLSQFTGRQLAGAAAVRPPPSPRLAAQLLWTLANLPEPFGAPWVDDLLASVAANLQYASSSKTLVVLLWGLGKLGHRTRACPGWLDAWWAAYDARRRAECAGSASNLCCSCQAIQQAQRSAQLQGHTEEALITQPQQHQQQHQSLEQESSHVGSASDSLGLLSAVLWSFNKVRQAPTDPAWLHVVLQAAGPLLPAAPAGTFAAFLQQLVSLRVWPGQVWLAAAAAVLLQKWQQQHHQQQQQQRGVLLYALACLYKLGYVPAGVEAAQLKTLVVAGK